MKKFFIPLAESRIRDANKIKKLKKHQKTKEKYDLSLNTHLAEGCKLFFTITFV